MREPEADPAEFERFYAQTAPSIRAYIVRHCGDRGSADDLFQITFIKFLGSRMAATLQAPQARAYLYRIASNVIADHGRALKRRERLHGSLRESPRHARPVPESSTPQLREALRSLSDREQQLLWLVYAEGFSHKEVASIMNVSHASVKVLAFRARRKLSKLLSEGGFRA